MSNTKKAWSPPTQASLLKEMPQLNPIHELANILRAGGKPLSARHTGLSPRFKTPEDILQSASWYKDRRKRATTFLVVFLISVAMTLLSVLAWTLLIPSTTAITFKFPDCTADPLKNNTVCDTSKDPITRAKALITVFTDEELMANTGNTSPGVARLGLPAYEWWSEALHGVASGHGVSFASSGSFSSATSFPQPILLGATFDDDLVKEIASVISTEARAFNNVGRAGIDFWTPNINPFKDPRWGRGQETPGEDPLHLSRYVYSLIQGLQGGIDPKPYFKVAADCKHYAAYDLESWQGTDRKHFDAKVTSQDLSEYYMPPFQSCVRDAKVASVMCSYNSVNGIPSCANSYLLQTLLRDYWGFDDERWVTADCDAVDNIFSTHNYTASYPQAVADALKAGTDLDCGKTYPTYLPAAFNQSLISRADLEKALVRQYASLIRLGYFDPADEQPYRKLAWSDVNSANAQKLARQAAAEGIVLLKNDGVLPLSKSIKKIAVIGPYSNATTQLQGNYFGVAPYLVSPAQGAKNAGYEATFANGTSVSGTTTDGFAEAIAFANASDIIVFTGGIDQTIERESHDRTTIDWPGNQLDLVKTLGTLGKPLIVVQFGGGQVDDSQLKDSETVNALLWAGYPGQSGGDALFDILTGRVAPAGRLPLTQYPANYTLLVKMTDMSLRPSEANPGRTYQWYTGAPVYEFGYGLHYTNFSVTLTQEPPKQYSITSLISPTKGDPLDLATLDDFPISVRNTGDVESDYVAMLYVRGGNGPTPAPIKRLISYSRLHAIQPSQTASTNLGVTLGSIARADDKGNLWLYNGTYQIEIDANPAAVTHQFELVGDSFQLTHWPQPPSA